MKIDHATLLGLAKEIGSQNQNTINKKLPSCLNQVGKLRLATMPAGQDKVEFSFNDDKPHPVTYNAALTTTAVSSPVVPTVTTISAATRISTIEQDRSGMSTAEVEARLRAISEAAAKDDFTGMTEGEIFGVIYNRYFTNFGNIFTDNEWSCNDLVTIREQYYSEMEAVLGRPGEKYGEYHAEMLGCADMTPEGKRQHIADQYKNSGVPMTPRTYMHMLHDMITVGAIDDKTYTALWIEIDMQITNAAMSKYYAQHGTTSGFNSDYSAFWVQNVDWDILWGSALSRLSTPECNYDEDMKSSLASVLVSLKKV